MRYSAPDTAYIIPRAPVVLAGARSDRWCPAFACHAVTLHRHAAGGWHAMQSHGHGTQRKQEVCHACGLAQARSGLVAGMPRATPRTWYANFTGRCAVLLKGLRSIRKLSPVHG